MQNKSVLISIRPQWCELILKGEKTVEVRKTRPKLELPFKCYIYQSKGRDRLIEVMKDGDLNYGEIYHGKPVFIKTVGYRSGYKGLFGNERKVIGEFVCDDIIEIVRVSCTMREARQYRAVKSGSLLSDDIFDYSCLSKNAIEKYLDGRKGYAWHISELVIYDKPKELSEFRTVCKYRNDDGSCRYNKIKCQNAVFDYNQDGSINLAECSCCIKRPPQSWCYVSEVENGRT